MVSRYSVTRRALLTGSTAPFVARGAGRARAACGLPVHARRRIGQPAPDGFVLWTRLAPEPLRPDPAAGRHDAGAVEVALGGGRGRGDAACGAQRRCRSPCRRCPSRACRIAGLAPGREYWYRLSPAARQARSAAPAPRRHWARRSTDCVSASAPAPIASRAISRLSPPGGGAPDLVLFLGDYIYEFIEPVGEPVRVHSDGVEATDLRTYRNRYAQYRTDPDLQPSMPRRRASSPGTTTRCRTTMPTAGRRITPIRQAFLLRRAAAYRAFWEHMPLPPLGDAAGAGRADLRPLRLRRPRALCGCWTSASTARAWPATGRQGGGQGGRCELPGAPRSGAAPISARRRRAGSASNCAARTARWNLFAQGQLMTEFKERWSGRDRALER